MCGVTFPWLTGNDTGTNAPVFTELKEFVLTKAQVARKRMVYESKVASEEEEESDEATSASISAVCSQSINYILTTGGITLYIHENGLAGTGATLLQQQVKKRLQTLPRSLTK
jgi:hypothetical protein